jgi:hypothetical protein
MRVARWSISRRGERLEVDLEASTPLSPTELDRLCEAVEPELDEGVREGVLDGASTRDPASSAQILGVIRRVGRLAMRYGKPFSVRPI